MWRMMCFVGARDARGPQGPGRPPHRVRRVLKRHETLATLQDGTPKPRTRSTPDSTGKPNFPHDLEHGSLLRRSGHISARRPGGPWSKDGPTFFPDELLVSHGGANARGARYALGGAQPS